jgi:hypothetical protein
VSTFKYFASHNYCMSFLAKHKWVDYAMTAAVILIGVWFVFMFVTNPPGAAPSAAGL